MSSEKYLAYRGDIQAIEGYGNILYVAVRHSEGQPVGLWALDMEKISLNLIPIGCGVTALAVEKGRIWAAGEDGKLFERSGKTKPAAKGPNLAEPAKALVLLSGARVAVLVKNEILILSQKDGKVLQKLELPDPGTVIASDETRTWLAAGTASGVVSVFESEDKQEFSLSESARIHQGAVTALIFEPGELRIVSAGTDQGVFITYARGKLEPEDRAKGAGHTDRISALISGPNRFYSGGADKCIKAWPRPGNAKPVTLKEGVGRITDLSLVVIEKQLHIVTACEDNSLRCYPLDEEGRFKDMALHIRDAYAQAYHESKQTDPGIRENTLKALARYGDARSLSILANRVKNETDPKLRKLATQLIGNSGHPQAGSHLEGFFSHQAEAVRIEALAGLRSLKGQDDLRPLRLAIGTGKSDIGVIAVNALEKLAVDNEDPREELIKALASENFDIRLAALRSIEIIGSKDGPEGILPALETKHADIRRFTLIRLFQRNLCDRIAVQTVLRQMIEDRDETVRLCAFLITVASRQKLVNALRSLDPDMHRKMFEIETIDIFQIKKDEKPKDIPKIKKVKKIDLDPGDDAPLLQAMAARSTDICLSGAMGMAALGDTRAFGLLLQLSREEDVAVRTAICKSLGFLADPRSIRLLRSFLKEDAVEIRDAAFSALVIIHAEKPFLSARAGLEAAHEDVKQRGLQIVTREIRKKKKKISDEALSLLLQALNDSVQGIRSEAFKTVINQEIGGSAKEALKFVMKSVHHDIRHEVLTEIMARWPIEWAGELLETLMNDQHRELRKAAFEYALEKAKDSDYSSLDAARGSVFADIRLAALNHLIGKKTSKAQGRIAKALEDDDQNIRLKAMDALTAIVDKDALSKALSSPHRDVRAGAATALARQGDRAALDPLIELIKIPEDEQKKQLLASLGKALKGVGELGEQGDVEPGLKKQWIASVEKALEGIAELGDPKALDAVVLLVKSEHASIQKASVSALAWICGPGKDSPLQQAVKHSDSNISALAAFGLAICGNPAARSSVFSTQGEKILGETRQLAAALALDGELNQDDADHSDFTAYENHLLTLLDHRSKNLRQTALISLMLRELASWEDQPRRCIACLSAQSPDTRITAGAGISAFGDKNEFIKFVLDIVNDQGEKPAWKISPECIRDISDLVTFGDSQARARCAWMIWHLTEEKESAWNQAWEIFSRRYAGEIKDCRKVSDKLGKPKIDRSYLDHLSFGAYVGLVREQGGYHERGSKPESGPHVIRVRQKALRLILNMAQKNEAFAGPAQAVFIQAMGDPNQPVRLQAFEQLQTLGMAPDVLGTEALSNRFTDLGVMGLKLLTHSKSPQAADDIIRDVMMSRADGLETEAAKMRMAHLSVVQVASQALEAGSQNLRRQGVNWLSEAYGKDENAKAELVKAIDSRFRQVRVFAAFSLAGHKDQKAFSTLCDLLRETRTVSDPALNQKRIITSLVNLGDSGAADHFLDRIEDDPEKNAEKDRLLRGAGQFRNPGIADRLLKMMENKEWRKGAYGAFIIISGYDQPIEEDPEEENPHRESDRKWLEKQHPRNDTVLSKLLARCLELNDPSLIRSMIPFARWAMSNEVDPILSELTAYPDDRIRHNVLESLGWRARKRSAPVDALVRTLEHRDPDSKFLAAEALAKAGHDNGITILLTAVDLMSDIRFRMRAVLALGELADERALDMLLKLATEQGHALQETALEAIGHMGKSDKADHIFDLLKKYAQEYGGIGQMAVKGLRWLNTPRAWNLIREKAAEPHCANRDLAIELLGCNDDPGTRELLLRIIREDEDDYYSYQAFEAAQKLWEPGALELDYALLHSGWSYKEEDAIKRVCNNGDPEDIFKLFPYCLSNVQPILEAGLLKRSPLPVAPAKKALQSPFPETVRTAARILGRAHGIDAGPVETALTVWSEKWKTRQGMLKAKAIQDDHQLKQIAECLTQLAWASGQLSKNPNILLSLVHEQTEDSLYKPVKLQTVAAFGHFEKDPDVIRFLESALSDPDKVIRRAATESLSRVKPGAKVKLAEVILSDHTLFNRTAAYTDVQELVTKGTTDIHGQGVVMSHLVQAGDSDPVFQIAVDTNLNDTVRMGAIETLARMAGDAAEKQLVKIGKSEQADEELRKAAWRGLRRSKRVRIRKSGICKDCV